MYGQGGKHAYSEADMLDSIRPIGGSTVELVCLQGSFQVMVAVTVAISP